jgi:hypothetical protein
VNKVRTILPLNTRPDDVAGKVDRLFFGLERIKIKREYPNEFGCIDFFPLPM